MLEETLIGAVTKRDYCITAGVFGPYEFTYGDCIKSGADTARAVDAKYRAGEICWYAYQYEDKSGSSADIVGPSQACLTKYKDDEGFKETVNGLHKAFLTYVDLAKANPGAVVSMPDIREFIDFPPELLGEKKASKWKWALGVIAVLAAAGGVVIYVRRKPRATTVRL